MPVPRLIEENDFRTSRFGQLADQIEGNLSDVIAQAETHIESKLGRALSVSTHTETHWPRSDTVFLRQRPIVSVTSVRRRSTVDGAWQTVPLAAFDVEEAAGFLRDADGGLVAGWQVEVVYTAGYNPMPDDIKAAVILQTALFAYQDLEIYGSGDAKAPGLRYMLDDLDRILKPYAKIVLPPQ